MHWKCKCIEMELYVFGSVRTHSVHIAYEQVNIGIWICFHLKMLNSNNFTSCLIKVFLMYTFPNRFNNEKNIEKICLRANDSISVTLILTKM